LRPFKTFVAFIPLSLFINILKPTIMKRISILLLAFLCGSTVAFAQVREPASPQDHMEFQGYIIHLMPAAGGTYSYYIVKENKVVLRQSHNPFTGSSVGLGRKEDVYKVARWQIQNVKSWSVPQMASRPQKQIPGFVKLPPALQQRFQQKPLDQRPLLPSRVPSKIAEELHIDLGH
jgi:hypothetical protein